MGGDTTEYRIEPYEDSIGYIELIANMGTCLDVVNAARVSFDTESNEFTKKDARLLKYLWRNKHTSPFEQCAARFRIKAPLFVVRQHQRHRTWSYNEVSRRYTDVDLEFYTPTQFRPQHPVNRQASHDELSDPIIYSMQGSTLIWNTCASTSLKNHTESSVKLYNDMLKAGVCREQARMVLPQNMYVHYIASANLLNIMKFINLRDKPEAQWEIRVLAQAMDTMLSSLYPKVWAAFKIPE